MQKPGLIKAHISTNPDSIMDLEVQLLRTRKMRHVSLCIRALKEIASEVVREFVRIVALRHPHTGKKISAIMCIVALEYHPVSLRQKAHWMCRVKL